MIISLVAAMGRGRVIGVDNRLPWHLPADLKHFRRTTLGKPVLMGRKTYDSIGKPLPGRHNIVVSRHHDLRGEGVTVVDSIDAAFAAAQGADEVMVIGGASFYAQTLPRAHRLYLTEIHHDFAGDAFFPAFAAAEWRETVRSDHAADAANPYDYSFLILERVV